MGSAFPFFSLFGGGQSSSSESTDESKELRYPRNSVADAFFQNMRPDEKVVKEMQNLKYPEIPFLTKATSDALSFITHVRQGVEGWKDQVTSNQEVRNIAKVVEGVLKVRFNIWNI